MATLEQLARIRRHQLARWFYQNGDGLDLDVIAEIMDVSRRTVTRYVGRDGNVLGRINPGDALRLHGEDYTPSEIAQRLNTSPESVYRVLRKAGLRPNKKRTLPDKVRGLHDRGASMSVAAQRLHISVAEARAALRASYPDNEEREPLTEQQKQATGASVRASWERRRTA